MSKWKRWTALALAAVLLAGGSWAGLLAGWHSATTMGQATGQLPRVVLQADGGIRLTFGEKGYGVEGERMKEIWGELKVVEPIIPRGLKVAVLSGLTGLFWLEQQQRPAVGQKRLTGGISGAEEQWL